MLKRQFEIFADYFKACDIQICQSGGCCSSETLRHQIVDILIIGRDPLVMLHFSEAAFPRCLEIFYDYFTDRRTSRHLRNRNLKILPTRIVSEYAISIHPRSRIVFYDIKNNPTVAASNQLKMSEIREKVGLHDSKPHQISTGENTAAVDCPL